MDGANSINRVDNASTFYFIYEYPTAPVPRFYPSISAEPTSHNRSRGRTSLRYVQAGEPVSSLMSRRQQGNARQQSPPLISQMLFSPHDFLLLDRYLCSLV